VPFALGARAVATSLKLLDAKTRGTCTSHSFRGSREKKVARLRAGPLPTEEASGFAPLIRASRCSGRRSSSDLVECGVGNLVGFNPRRSFNDFFQDLGHFSVVRAVIGVGVLLVVP